VDSKWRGQNRHMEIDHLTDRTGHKSVPKIDIRKSIISRIERVTNPSEFHGSRLCPSQISVPNLTDRTGHDVSVHERCHTSFATPSGTARLDHASIEGRRRCSQTRGAFGTICCTPAPTPAPTCTGGRDARCCNDGRCSSGRPSCR